MLLSSRKGLFFNKISHIFKLHNFEAFNVMEKNNVFRLQKFRRVVPFMSRDVESWILNKIMHIFKTRKYVVHGHRNNLFFWSYDRPFFRKNFLEIFSRIFFHVQPWIMIKFLHIFKSRNYVVHGLTSKNVFFRLETLSLQRDVCKVIWSSVRSKNVYFWIKFLHFFKLSFFLPSLRAKHQSRPNSRIQCFQKSSRGK